MPTQTKENYLKAIYALSQKDESVSLSDLSRELQVSMPTANNMVKKLQENEWIDYEKYKPLVLTPKGHTLAALIIRKHRLAEMFLSKVMGFGWEEVHDIAEDMEHIQSDKLFDRMDELLGYPTIDPHGSPIPDKEGKITQKTYTPLSEIKVGKKVRLCTLSDRSTDLLVYLNNKGITLGTEIQVLSLESFDKSIQVSYLQQKSVTLSREVCSCLLVEIIG